MPRIKLAFWHDGHAPGDEVDVDDDTLRALKRDGRVAEVLPDKLESTAPVEVAPESAPEPVPSRRSRKSTEE